MSLTTTKLAVYNTVRNSGKVFLLVAAHHNFFTKSIFSFETEKKNLIYLVSLRERLITYIVISSSLLPIIISIVLNLKPQSTATGHLITLSRVILEDKYYQYYALWHIPTIKKNHFKHGENEESSET